MKTIAILALLGNISAMKFLGDEAPVWDDSQLMKTAKAMAQGDDKFGRFKAFEARRKAGTDDYTHNKPLQFVDKNEKENKQQEQPKGNIQAAAPTTAAPQTTPQATQPAPVAKQALPEKKQVFYFDGEDMVKRDAMVQLNDVMRSKEWDLEAKPGDNAEYPYLHIHTMGGQDVDPVTREPVNVVHGYNQRSFAQHGNKEWDLEAKKGDNAEYPYLHIHTESGENIDPVTFEPVNVVHGYSQRSLVQLNNQEWDLEAKPGDNAEYPYLHVHTESGENIDPVTFQPVNVVHGYIQTSEEQPTRELRRIVAI